MIVELKSVIIAAMSGEGARESERVTLEGEVVPRRFDVEDGPVRSHRPTQNNKFKYSLFSLLSPSLSTRAQDLELAWRTKSSRTVRRRRRSEQGRRRRNWKKRN